MSNPLTATKERVHAEFIKYKRGGIYTIGDLQFLDSLVDSIAVEVLGLVEDMIPTPLLPAAVNPERLEQKRLYNLCREKILSSLKELKNSLTEKV